MLDGNAPESQLMASAFRGNVGSANAALDRDTPFNVNVASLTVSPNDSHRLILSTALAQSLR